ncbi:MAG: outer membrane beta-barrel protein [Bacteroidales bacterium]
MKRAIAILIAGLLIVPLFAQEVEPAEEPEARAEAPVLPDTEKPPEVEVEEETIKEPDTVKITKKMEVVEAPEGTKVTLGENEVLIIEENGDTIRVKLGSKGISIVEGEDGTAINIIEMEEEENDEKGTVSTRKRSKKFKPHFAGFEIGLNNYLTPDFSIKLPQDQRFMDLNTGRSWNFNLNILEYGIGLGTDKAGVVTGLGFEWTNYMFDNQNSIRKDENGAIAEYVPEQAGNIIKSKFNMTYITAPLLLEFQIPAGKKRIHLSGGLIGGVKIASNTKIKYEISGEKSKEKAKGDYNLAPLRYGVTARLGYRAINLYANYYLTPLFSENDGPELYPFSIGLCLIPF